MRTWEKIPIENRKDIIDVVEYVKAMLPSVSKKHLVYLFEVYYMFVEPNSSYKKKITCRDDRSKVLSVLSTYVKIWKKQEEIL